MDVTETAIQIEKNRWNNLETFIFIKEYNENTSHFKTKLTKLLA